MLLINYFRWMRRWRVNWQADNWRAEHEDAYAYFIEWHSKPKTSTIPEAVRISKGRQSLKRFPLKIKPQVDTRTHPVYGMVTEIDKAVYKIAGVHVIYISHQDKLDYCMVDCCIGKNGRHEWLEPVMPEHKITALPTLTEVRYETIRREPLYFSFQWLAYLPREEIQYRIARDIAYARQCKEDEFQASLELKRLNVTEKSVLIELARDYHREFDVYSPSMNWGEHAILKRLANRGLCDMLFSEQSFAANDKTRLVAQLTTNQA